MLSPPPEADLMLIKAALKHSNYRREWGGGRYLISGLYKRKACESDCIACTLLDGITHKYFFTIVVKIQFSVGPARPGQYSSWHQGAMPSPPGPGGSAAGSTDALGGKLCCLLYLELKSAVEHCCCRRTACCLRKTSQLSYGPPLESPGAQEKDTSIRGSQTGGTRVQAGLMWVSHLDHDEFSLPGPPVGPLLPEAQANIERREGWSLATLVGYHPLTTHTFILKKQILNSTF